VALAELQQESLEYAQGRGGLRISAAELSNNVGPPHASVAITLDVYGHVIPGLAKAFFYAGSRSLLVSHWPVGSVAAVSLTTRMLKEVANDNSVGRAEGLRRSMLALMETPDKPHFAHPMFWAPFVVVGEGGMPKIR
jgi:hypothetical protein